MDLLCSWLLATSFNTKVAFYWCWNYIECNADQCYASAGIVKYKSTLVWQDDCLKMLTLQSLHLVGRYHVKCGWRPVRPCGALFAGGRWSNGGRAGQWTAARTCLLHHCGPSGQSYLYSLYHSFLFLHSHIPAHSCHSSLFHLSFNLPPVTTPSPSCLLSFTFLHPLLSFLPISTFIF